MSKQIKVLAAKSDDLSSIPRTHTVEAKNRLVRVPPIIEEQQISGKPALYSEVLF